MLNIKQELQIILFRKGLSMSKLTRNMKRDGAYTINIASLSRMLTQKTIKFNTAQTILDYLGYEVIIREKERN